MGVYACVRVFQVSKFISESAELCTPARVHLCDGSDEENESLLQQLQGAGVVKPLTKYENKYVHPSACAACVVW